MKKSKRQLLMSWIVAIMMIVNIIPFSTAYAEGDVTGKLKNVSVGVTQNGVDVNETGTISSALPIRIKVDFTAVLLEGDPNKIVQGDTATFLLCNAFTLKEPIVNKPLYSGTILVGHVTVSEDSEGMIKAVVAFDGSAEEDGPFSGDWDYADCFFEAELEYDATGIPEGSNNPIEILGKSYIVHVPVVPVEYEMKKTGTPDLANKRINWSIEITAEKGGAAIDADLGGFIFSDDLSNAGAYIDGSFAVVDFVAENLSYADNVLTYTFPEGAKTTKTITYQTAIDDADYYNNTEVTMTNAAELREDDVLKASDSVPVKFTPTWIVKGGESGYKSGDYDPANQTITWTVTVNQMGATLTKAAITDVLEAGMTLMEAKAQAETAPGVWGDIDGKTWSTAPDGGKYELGTITTPVRLIIVTKVENRGNTGTTKSYSNSATLSWEGGPGTGLGSNKAGATIGYSAMSKSGVLDKANQKIKWTVTVDPRGQNFAGFKVYDLLVYGSSINLTTVTGIPADVTGKLTARYNQQYAENFVLTEGTISEADGKPTVIPIYQDEVRVADLVVLTISSTTGILKYSFDTKVVNPDVYLGNGSTTIRNTASLFSGGTSISSAPGSVSYKSNVIFKEMLKREAMGDPVDGVNNYTRDADSGFDYVDKSVIFRLNVNYDGFNLSGFVNAAGEPMGKMTVTDTLPPGWEFVEISDGKDYLIFEGEGSLVADTTIKAKAAPLETPVTGLAASVSGETAVFTFDSLDKQYVILVKARPTGETLAGYFDSNESNTVKNTATITAQRWTTGSFSERNVTIVSDVLTKDFTRTDNGILEWEVEYRPCTLEHPGARLEDTLPEGIDLRTDSFGALIIEGNIKVVQLTLKPDGTYADGEDVTDDVEISYDNNSRVLSFSIPYNSKAYRFTYITDITGDPGVTGENKIVLFGGTEEQEGTKKPFYIDQSDAGASLQRNGWITITKLGGSGNTLDGAEFTIFALDGETVIRKGITKGGIVTLKGIPAGTYIIRETAAPDGYSSEGVDHTLVVTKDVSGIVTSSIDGGGNTVTLYNHETGAAGNLTISKTIAGNIADLDKLFKFQVEFDGSAGEIYSYVGHGGAASGSLSSGTEFYLGHGQSITIVGIDEGTGYTVTEENEDYTVQSTGAAGEIAADQTLAAAFTNIKNFVPDTAPQTGSLTISKTVSGEGGDTSRKFSFTVTFDGEAGTAYAYTGTGTPDGVITSGGTVTLAHGQSITITGMPGGTAYTVTEADYSTEGYALTTTGASGSITANTNTNASFTNTYDESLIPDPESPTGPAEPENTGSLTISKTVSGDLGDKDATFTFVLKLSAEGSFAYTGSKSGTVTDGQAVTLKHGQHIVIAGIPVGTAYTVTEKEADKGGYTTKATGASGTITEAGATAAFVNTRSSVPQTGDTSMTILWSVVFIASAAALALMSGARLKSRSKKAGTNR